MKAKAPFFFFAAVMLLASYSNDAPVPTPQTDTTGNPYKVTPEEAQDAVMDFLSAFDSSDLTRSTAISKEQNTGRR